MPFAILLLLITICGIPVGLLGLAIYIFSFVFSKLLTLVVFSELITQRCSDKFDTPWKRWGVFCLLAVILTIVSGIDFIAAIFVFGALIIGIGKSWSQKK